MRLCLEEIGGEVKASRFFKVADSIRVISGKVFQITVIG
jgi:hypothetical protein